MRGYIKRPQMICLVPGHEFLSVAQALLTAGVNVFRPLSCSTLFLIKMAFSTSENGLLIPSVFTQSCNCPSGKPLVRPVRLEEV